jgi:DNA-binding NtrC family response regulator
MPTVLFIDDEPQVLVTFPRLFRRDSFRVVTAHSAAAALAIIDAQEISVVVTDHRMPGMLGGALLAHLAAHAPHIGRILLTGDFGLQDDGIATAAALEVLRKPASSVDLRAAIGRMLARGTIPIARVATR